MIELFVFLITREKSTYKEIADKLECTTRTAYRKVAKLSLAVPIVTKQGRYGGVMIMPGYKKEFIKKLKKDVIL